ncbi:hypothetical protein NP493_927g00064 [Ridgeia piscesae]|uniref:Uncharacterized protein n=1 Tax=Ridgeia piscesae TaxID=27915 RepID=A0AAD9KJY7_RIDPI|nr:hypothetical protein NP493_927g00064 [Ridgeia piscesae]
MYRHLPAEEGALVNGSLRPSVLRLVLLLLHQFVHLLLRQPDALVESLVLLVVVRLCIQHLFVVGQISRLARYHQLQRVYFLHRFRPLVRRESVVLVQLFR